MAPRGGAPRDPAYDESPATARERVRAEWAEQIDARLRELDLATRFAQEGRSYVELDDDGYVAERQPSAARSADGA
jgi:hypothetical protein